MNTEIKTYSQSAERRVRDAAANENQPPRNNICADDSAGNTREEAPPQSITKEGVFKQFEKIHIRKGLCVIGAHGA